MFHVFNPKGLQLIVSLCQTPALQVSYTGLGYEKHPGFIEHLNEWGPLI